MDSNIKDAIDAPRLHHQFYPEFVQAEEFIYTVKMIFYQFFVFKI